MKSLRVQKRKIKDKSYTDSSTNEDDAICLYCEIFYSKSTEGWISCSHYRKWAHNSCAGLDSEDDENFFKCELCKQ